jgi:hypothetical protein
MIERVLSKENMAKAYRQVFGNKGCAGIEGMEVEELQPYLKAHWEEIKSAILNGDYRPQAVLGKEIESNWDKFVRKCKEITRKSKPYSLTERTQKLRELGYGWIGYFQYAGLKTRLEKLDGKLTGRLRYCIWKSWKRLRTRIRNLKRLGVPTWLAITWGLNRKGGWHIVNTPILKTTITIERLKKRGYKPMSEILAS